MNECKDCFTKIEFSHNVVQTTFDDIERVLSNKDSIRMFMVDDYMFKFTDYVKEDSVDVYGYDIELGETCHQIVGEYITPIPHMTYMSEEDIWFKIDNKSVDRFTFFVDDEFIISMHGMLFIDGEFKENLIHRFNISEISNLTNDLCSYILRIYNENSREIHIQNSFKCIGLSDHKKGNKQ